MIGKKIFQVLVVFLFISGINTYAAEELVPTVSVAAAEPKDAYWVFSGMVTNESGDQFGYFFQMQRQDNQFHIQTAVLDEQNNQVIFSYEQRETIPNSEDFKWKVGDAFLHFNPINESWVFGVKTADKKGFNFKVDMLNQPIAGDEIQTLRPGLEALVHQTSRLNGHLRSGKEGAEQFVTANNAWFSKVWLSAKQDSPHALNSGFCRFIDGAGFYSENLHESDAKRAALASWRDALGNSVKMSQFVNMHLTEDNIWKVNLSLPKLEFKLINRLEDNPVSEKLVAGFFQEAPRGFCFFSQQDFTA